MRRWPTGCPSTLFTPPPLENAKALCSSRTYCDYWSLEFYSATPWKYMGAGPGRSSSLTKTFYFFKIGKQTRDAGCCNPGLVCKAISIVRGAFK